MTKRHPPILPYNRLQIAADIWFSGWEFGSPFTWVFAGPILLVLFVLILVLGMCWRVVRFLTTRMWAATSSAMQLNQSVVKSDSHNLTWHVAWDLFGYVIPAQVKESCYDDTVDALKLMRAEAMLALVTPINTMRERITYWCKRCWIEGCFVWQTCWLLLYCACQTLCLLLPAPILKWLTGN